MSHFFISQILIGIAICFDILSFQFKERTKIDSSLPAGFLYPHFHPLHAGSPGAVLMEAIFIGSNLVGYFRYYIRPKKQALS